MRTGARLVGAVVLALFVTAVRAQSPAPAGSPGPGGMSAAEIRELIDAAQATAKATREAVDYSRVTPDLLTQILAKLDKLEDKLDKVENAIKAGAPRRR